MKISGVYKITNTITSDFYVGSSKDIKLRWANHKSPSTWKELPNSKLYKDMASYGLDNFTFEVLEKTSSLKECEQYFIDQLKPSYNNYRAKGQDKDRIRQYYKEYHKEHKEENKARVKKYYNAHRAEINNYYQRLCLYEGKTLTLNALRHKLSKLGFSHPVQEAKKYLIVK